MNNFTQVYNKNQLSPSAGKHIKGLSAVSCTLLMIMGHTPLALAGGGQIINNVNYKNPAALSEVTEFKFVIGGEAIYGKVPLEGYSSHAASPTPTYGSAESKKFIYLYDFQLATRINDKLVVGFDYTNPFATKIDYGNSSFLKYEDTHSQFYTHNLAFSAAYQVHPKLALGAGVDAQHAYVEENGYVIDELALPNYYLLHNEVSDWAYGGHLGLLYKPFEYTSIGLAWFSQFVHHAVGHSQYAGVKTDIAAQAVLPATTRLSIKQGVAPGYLVFADIAYSHWGSFQSATIENTAYFGQNITEEYAYRNSWRYELGLAHVFSPTLVLLGSVAYDETPTTNAARRPELPESNHFIFGVAAIKEVYPCTKIALKYAYAHFNNVEINNSNADSDTFAQGKPSAHVLGLQLTWER